MNVLEPGDERLTRPVPMLLSLDIGQRSHSLGRNGTWRRTKDANPQVPQAGQISEEFNGKRIEGDLMERSRRTYRKNDEDDRDRALSSVEVKDQSYYSSRHDQWPYESLWNETSRLQPNIAQFTANNVDPSTTFKKQITDFERISQDTRDDQFTNQFKKLLQSRQEAHDR